MSDAGTHRSRVGLPTPAVRERFERLVFAPVWGLLAGVAVAVLLVGAPTGLAQWVPLIASALLLGLPHGAVDHLALPRLYEDSLTPRWMAIVAGLYAVIGGAYALVWFLAPTVAFVIFIAITWLHWGQGDVYPLTEIAAVEHLQTPVERGLTVLVRGGFPMLVPLLAFPDQYREVAERLVGVFATDPAATLSVVFEPSVRLGLGGGFFALVAGALVLGFARAGESGRRGWLLDATELAVLSVFFLTVPPILAIGIYFCFWHALRHVVRLLALDGAASHAIEGGSWSTAAWRFVRDAAPLTAVSLGFLGLAYLLVPESPGSVPDLVALYLVLIAVLTLPHVVVVTWMDHVQGIFD